MNVPYAWRNYIIFLCCLAFIYFSVTGAFIDRTWDWASQAAVLWIPTEQKWQDNLPYWSSCSTKVLVYTVLLIRRICKWVSFFFNKIRTGHDVFHWISRRFGRKSWCWWRAVPLTVIKTVGQRLFRNRFCYMTASKSLLYERPVVTFQLH